MTDPARGAEGEATPHHRVAIVGAGFGGLGASIVLGRAGVRDVVVLERGDDVGGVWRDNTYPGCACDVQSHLYELSFAPNPDWTRRYPRQPEIQAYLRRVARDFGVAPRIRLRTVVRESRWDAAASRWRISTSGGDLTADWLVSATGGLSEPQVPDLPGRDTFTGPAFHSAQWRHDVALAGRRVVVVGTGASAVQFVPELQRVAAHVTVLQRSAPWVVPRRDRPIPAAWRAAYRALPALARLRRLGVWAQREVQGNVLRHLGLNAVIERYVRWVLRRAVPDPALRARLTPPFRLGCKRILLSDDWYPALQRPNVTVAPAAAEVRPDGVVDAEGTFHRADVLIWGTGFHVTDVPAAARVHGRDGRSLAEAWAGSPTAHLGTMVAGFPNLFLLQGPNTGLGHTSVLLMIEGQLAFVADALRWAEAHGARTIEPTPGAQAAFVAEMDRRLATTVWNRGGCRSWYLDATGRNSTLWPAGTPEFRRRLSRFRPAEFAVG